MMKGMERLGIGGRGGFALGAMASTLVERRYMLVHGPKIMSRPSLYLLSSVSASSVSLLMTNNK